MSWLSRLFGRKPKQAEMGMQAAPVTFNPTQTQRILRTRERIKRIRAHLPNVPRNRVAEYEAELKRLQASLVASGFTEE